MYSVLVNIHTLSHTHTRRDTHKDSHDCRMPTKCSSIPSFLLSFYHIFYVKLNCKIDGLQMNPNLWLELRSKAHIVFASNCLTTRTHPNMLVSLVGFIWFFSLSVSSLSIRCLCLRIYAALCNSHTNRTKKDINTETTKRKPKPIMYIQKWTFRLINFSAKYFCRPKKNKRKKLFVRCYLCFAYEHLLNLV